MNLHRFFKSNLFFRYKLQFPFNEFTTNNRGVALFKNGESEYDIETLLAMILWSAKKTTEAYAEQSVKVRDITCGLITYEKLFLHNLYCCP